MGFIFDMDGTMVDNMMTHHRAWQLKLAEKGIDFTIEQVKSEIHGKNEEILERLFGNRFTPEQRRQIASEKEARYREVFLKELKLIDGLSAFLEAAASQGIPMAVGTAAPPENVYFVMDNLQLWQYFKGVVHAGLVTKGKPDPEVFEKAAATMGVPLSNCLVFEDSPTGVETARRAGCKAIVITTTHDASEFERFDNVVRTISDYATLSLSEVKWLFQNK